MGIVELGHTGLHAKDLDRMKDFYSRVLGLTITDEAPERGIVFLSSRPEYEHHEFVLARGRTAARDVKLVNQISWRVDSLTSLQEYYRALLADKAEIIEVVTHGNAIGVYFRDPDGNKVEVYWRTGLDVTQPFKKDIGLDGSADDVLARNQRLISEEGTGM
jgi:catechol 2,3-dioxygenase-like lactoylglutathione lyase family enzyme